MYFCLVKYIRSKKQLIIHFIFALFLSIKVYGLPSYLHYHDVTDTTDSCSFCEFLLTNDHTPILPNQPINFEELHPTQESTRKERIATYNFIYNPSKVYNALYCRPPPFLHNS